MGYIDGKWQTILYGIHTDPMGYTIAAGGISLRLHATATFFWGDGGAD